MIYNAVAALLKGLRTLETVNEIGPVGLGAIQKATGLPKATTLRMLETLNSEGYVDYDPDKKTYSVAVRVLALSNKFSSEQFLLRSAAPIMKDLRSRLGWPSDLAIFQHDKMVIVDTNRQPGTLSTNRSVGSRIPILASATGRAYISFCPKHEKETLLERLRGSDDKYEAVVNDPDSVTRIIEETRQRGYAISDREFLPINRSAAVPIIYSDNVVCCINFIALANMVSIDEMHEKYVPLLLEAKSKLEKKLNMTVELSS